MKRTNTKYVDLYSFTDAATQKMCLSADDSLAYHRTGDEPVAHDKHIFQTTLSCYVQRSSEPFLLDIRGNEINFYFDSKGRFRVYPYARLHSLLKLGDLNLKFPDCLIDDFSNRSLMLEVQESMGITVSTLDLLNLIEPGSHFCCDTESKPIELMFTLPASAFKFQDVSSYPENVVFRSTEPLFKIPASKFRITKDGHLYTRETADTIVYFSRKTSSYKLLQIGERLRTLLDEKSVFPRSCARGMFNTRRNVSRLTRLTAGTVTCTDCGVSRKDIVACASCLNRVCFTCTDNRTRSYCLDCFSNTYSPPLIPETTETGEIDVVDIIADRISSSRSISPIDVYKETSGSRVNLRLGYFRVSGTRYYFSSDGRYYIVNGKPYKRIRDDIAINALRDFTTLSRINRGITRTPEVNAGDEFYTDYSLEQFYGTQQVPNGYFKLDGKIIYRGPGDQFWTSDGMLSHTKTDKQLLSFVARKTGVPIGMSPPIDGVSSYGFWNEFSSMELLRSTIQKMPDYETGLDCNDPYTESADSTSSEEGESSSLVSEHPDLPSRETVHEKPEYPEIFGEGSSKSRVRHCEKRLKFTQRSSPKYEFEVSDDFMQQIEVNATLLIVTAVATVFALLAILL